MEERNERKELQLNTASITMYCGVPAHKIFQYESGDLKRVEYQDALSSLILDHVYGVKKLPVVVSGAIDIYKEDVEETPLKFYRQSNKMPVIKLAGLLGISKYCIGAIERSHGDDMCHERKLLTIIYYHVFGKHFIANLKQIDSFVIQRSEDRRIGKDTITSMSKTIPKPKKDQKQLDIPSETNSLHHIAEQAKMYNDTCGSEYAAFYILTKIEEGLQEGVKRPDLATLVFKYIGPGAYEKSVSRLGTLTDKLLEIEEVR